MVALVRSSINCDIKSRGSYIVPHLSQVVKGVKQTVPLSNQTSSAKLQVGQLALALYTIIYYL